MGHIAWCLWVNGNGDPTRGDLYELMNRVCGGDDYWDGANSGKVEAACDALAYGTSAFAKPVSRADIIEAAIVWASEHVEVAPRRRKMYHQGLFKTTFITGDAINKFLRGHDQQKLACAIAHSFIRWAVPVDRDLISTIMDEVISLETPIAR